MALKQNQEKINHNETLGFSQWNLHKVVKLQIEKKGMDQMTNQKQRDYNIFNECNGRSYESHNETMIILKQKQQIEKTGMAEMNNQKQRDYNNFNEYNCVL